MRKARGNRTDLRGAMDGVAGVGAKDAGSADGGGLLRRAERMRSTGSGAASLGVPGSDAARARAPLGAALREGGARRKVRFPIGLKLVAMVSALLVSALLVMNALASTFFLRDATTRVEENNHAIAQLTARTVESELRAMAELAALALRLAGADPTGESTARIMAANAGLLYVEGPGGEALANRQALSALGATEASVKAAARAASGRGNAPGVGVATLAPGLPALSITVPSSDAGIPLVAVVSALPFIGAFDAPGIVETWAVNAEGVLILSADSRRLAARSDLSALPIVTALRGSPAGNGLLRYPGADGEERLGAFARTAFAGVGIVAEAPASLAFEAVEAIGRRNYLILGAVLSIALALAWFFSRSLTEPVAVLMEASRRVEGGDFAFATKSTTRDELGALIETFGEMCRGLAEREKIKDAFGRFVNKTVAELAMKGELRLGGERRVATVLFSDIRSFTAISETMQPERVVGFLNRYLSRMVSCVEATGGTVDKFVGDAIMAIWGVPVGTGRDTEAAALGALAMRSSLAEFNADRGGPEDPVIRIGIGINAGPVLAGQIGSERRMEYTVIGDAVNLASRIEALNKPFGTDILLSERAARELGEGWAFGELPTVEVKGKSEALRVYALLGREDDPARPRDLDALRAQLGSDAPVGTPVAEDERKYRILEAGPGGERP
ncbi:MAG: HAMP domain-containing protein [Spirochaetales bacterium]|nr:HAMP domain-containing protein [Spirochaetales bacterium]